MCSRKWLMPLSRSVSKREPTRTWIAAAALRAAGIGTSTSLSPFASLLRRTRTGSLLVRLGLALFRESGIDFQLVTGGAPQVGDVADQGFVALGLLEHREQRPLLLLELLARGRHLLLQLDHHQPGRGF